MTILIAEDEGTIAEVLAANLQHAGYESVIVEDGPSVLEYLARHQPELLLLDVLLPGIDGFSLCRSIRETSRLPIIMVTACVDEPQRLKGFDVGVDDYVCKPFSPSEVVARVRSLLRRAQSDYTSTADETRLGDLVLCQHTRRASFAGQPLQLTVTEFRLLSVLANAPNRIFTRNELLDRLQREHSESSDRAIDSHMKNLRRKLAAARPEACVVQGVYGEGYRVNFPFTTP